MTRVKGIDVSKHQGVIDWAKVANDGIKFTIVRVGYRGLTSGKLSEDPYFKRNIEGAIANGIDVGAYIYCTSINEEEAVEEANYLLKRIKPYNLTMPVCFDYEGFSNKENRNYGMTKEKITANCIAFQNVMKANGYTCLLYGSRAYLPKKFDLDELDDYLWVARYAGKNSVLDDEKYFPHIAGYDDRIAIWQYANNGTVAGINGKVDMNYMYIDVSKKEDKKEEKQEEEKMGVTINAYSKSKDGNKQLSKNFKVKEFACKDGSDPIFIAPSLVEILQSIRDHFGKAVTINSAYRTPAYNKKVGGATYSQHQYGTAADIRISGVKPKEVADFAETLMPNTGGIGIYSTFTHVDVREVKSRWNG